MCLRSALEVETAPCGVLLAGVGDGGRDDVKGEVTHVRAQRCVMRAVAPRHPQQVVLLRVLLLDADLRAAEAQNLLKFGGSAKDRWCGPMPGAILSIHITSTTSTCMCGMCSCDLKRDG